MFLQNKMVKLIFLVIQFGLLVQITKTCIFKFREPTAKELKLPGPWNDGSFTRNLSSCECGQQISPGQAPPWNVYIYNKGSFCGGTIVTSNLVATSHRCVRNGLRSQLLTYDAWNISSKYKAFLKKDEITVTASGVRNESAETFPVLKIIPNPQFLMSWKRKSEKLSYDSLDLLFIKVKADFTSHKELSPICIYEDSDDLDFVGKVGYYYTRQSVMPGVNISDQLYEGEIVTRKVCARPSGREKKHDPLSGFCFSWTTQDESLPPVTCRDNNMHYGGAVFFRKSNFSFLAGITYGFVYGGQRKFGSQAYVSNIIPMIKYLEYRAHQHHSTWCKLPVLGMDQNDQKNLSKGSNGSWPWEEESAQKDFQFRNESLDCVCGVPNNELTGRIAGGVEATPFEFGWMAAVNIYPSGKAASKGYGTCGGSVINERMILTAAHCLVNDAGRETKPENIEVFLNVHKRHGHAESLAKEVELALVHPAHAPARVRGYYDYDVVSMGDLIRNPKHVALLVLKEELKFSPLPEEPEKEPTPHLRPVCLPKMGEVLKLVGEQAMVSGWGLTNPDDETSGADKMQKIELPIIPLQRCRDTARRKVTDHFLCAGSLDKFKDAAKGDSGGPLSVMRGRRWTEVGLVSWGEDAYQNGKYHSTAALYTDVTDRVILPFVDYYANRLRLRWCSSEIPE